MAVHHTVVPGFRWQIAPSQLLVTWNSDIPYSLNDGALWAGRGMNVSLTAGVSASYEREHFGIHVAVAPGFTYSENLPFDIEPGREPGRSTYSSPWHLAGESADLPLRFGDQPLRRLDAGESGIAVRVRNVAAGFTTAAEWWGPGIRNALVMSNNAPGIPRVFVRSARPFRTRIGSFAGELQVGTLTESPFFDTLQANDHRAFNAFVLAYRPAFDSTLTFGVARAVYTPATGAIPPFGAAFNALRWRPPAGNGDTRPADQIASLFARWVFPASGFETYVEWARMDVFHSVSDALETPNNTDGYTLGFQWVVKTPRPGASVRLQGELSYLDQNIVSLDAPPVDFYTGRVAPQGYTQRGQVIGAAIGPGGSSQWIAGDYLVRRWQLGAFIGRIRWEDDALYRQQFTTAFSHDVSLLSGLRGAYRAPLADVAMELTVARRLNYLFQNGFSNAGHLGDVRIQNITFTTRITTRSPGDM